MVLNELVGMARCAVRALWGLEMGRRSKRMTARGWENDIEIRMIRYHYRLDESHHFPQEDEQRAGEKKEKRTSMTLFLLNIKSIY